MREIPELMPMVGEKDAMDFLLNLPVRTEDEETLCRVIKRVKYRFDQCDPVPPVFHKGMYGKKYDSYSCGKGGHIAEHRHEPDKRSGDESEAGCVPEGHGRIGA